MDQVLQAIRSNRLRPGDAIREVCSVRQAVRNISVVGKEKPAHLIPVVLITTGFLASLLTIYTLHPKTVVANGYLVAHKTSLYYTAHTIQIVTLLSAGLLSWFALDRGQRRIIVRPMMAFFLVAILFLLRNVGMDEILSTQLVGSTGIVPCLLSVLIVFGMREENHRVVDKLIPMSAFGLAALAAVASVRQPFHTRADALANIQGYLIALYVPALWLIFEEPRQLSSLRRLMRFVPITAYAIGSILTQTRLNLVLLVPAFGMYLYVQSKRKSILPNLLAISLAVMLGILAIPILEHTRLGESLEWSKLGLLERLKTDTRSDQIVAYFADMDAIDLLVGRGQDASYMWVGRWWHGGIDVGYLYLDLCGGVPLLLTYVILHIFPGFKALLHPIDSRQLACAATVVMWALRMISTGYMDYHPGYYTLLFCIGGCLTQRTPMAGVPAGASILAGSWLGLRETRFGNLRPHGQVPQPSGIPFQPRRRRGLPCSS